MQEQAKPLDGVTIRFMPDGTPAPKYLDSADVVRYIRLDKQATGNPVRTVAYYRDRFGLVGVRLSRGIVYDIDDVDALMRILKDPKRRGSVTRKRKRNKGHFRHDDHARTDAESARNVAPDGFDDGGPAQA